MADTGVKAPTAAESVGEAPWNDANCGWVNPANIFGAGEAEVTHASFDSPDQTYVLKAYGFDFSAIPDGSTIDGVQVVINARYAVAAVSLDLCQLLDISRAKVGTNKYATPQALTTSAANYTIGGATDKWGNSLTAAWVKDPDFGVAIGALAGGANSDVFIDSVTMQVWYTAPATYTKTVSLDGYLQKVFTKTPSLDGLLNKAGQTKTLTLDAYLKKTFGKTPSIDAFLTKVGLKTPALDALLQKLGLDETLSLDALLQKVGVEKTVSLDAILYAVVTYTITASLDGLLQKSDAKTVQADALLQKEQTKTVTADAYLQKEQTKSAVLDAFLFATILKTPALDGVLQKLGIERSSTLDALLLALGLERTVSLDALLTKMTEVSLGLDAFLTDSDVERSVSLDAYLKKTENKPVSLDGLLLGMALTRITTLDAILIAAGETSISASIDAVLQKFGMTKSASIDAFLSRVALTLTTSLDAYLSKGYAKELGLDALLTKSFSQGSTIDAFLQKQYTRQTSTDAILQKVGMARTALLDAILVEYAPFLAVLVSLDALLYKARSRSVGLDAILVMASQLASPRYTYNATARQREYDARKRKREYDAAPRKREHDDQ